MNLIASSSIAVQSNPRDSTTTRPPMKKKKVSKQGGGKSKATQDLQPQQICYLGRMPLEIIAEILSYTTTRDVLAVARCSKYFCQTLVSPTCEFIWKKARARCQPTRIPDPTPNFTECSYAAFIFDKGPCEVCGKITKSMYASFSLRLRLCTDTCKKKWRTQKSVESRPSDVPRYRAVVERLPRVEYRGFGYVSDVEDPFVEPTEFMFRKAQWQSAVDEYNKCNLDDNLKAKYDAEQAATVKTQKEIMRLGRELVFWRVLYEQQYERVHSENVQIVKGFAAQCGRTLYDLLQTRSIGSVYYPKNRGLETVRQQDLVALRLPAEEEMETNFEKRERRESENAYYKRRIDVAQYYKSLKAAKRGDDIFPPLFEFRKITIVQVLQSEGPGKGEDISGHLNKNALVAKLVQTGITQWKEETKARFAALLGHPGWKKTNTSKLHPVERLNARFLCKRCNARVVHNRWHCKSMSLAEVCNHQCFGLNKNERSKSAWRIDQFCVDERGVDIANQLLSCCGISADDPLSLKTIGKLGTRILCLSCPSQIVMDYKTMLSHCSRHEGMRIKLLSPAEGETMVKRAVEYGLLAQLTESASSAKALRAKRVYGCRHCEQNCVTSCSTEIAEAPIAALSAAEHMPQSPTPVGTSQVVKEKARGSRPKAGQEKPSKMFNFDGLRSHAKEKHGILWIGDEDFYRLDVDNNGVTTAAGTT